MNLFRLFVVDLVAVAVLVVVFWAMVDGVGWCCLVMFWCKMVLTWICLVAWTFFSAVGRFGVVLVRFL